MATPEEQAIQGVIDQIWETYDVDKSGALDKEETKKFVQDTLGNLGSGDEFSDEVDLRTLSGQIVSGYGYGLKNLTSASTVQICIFWRTNEDVGRDSDLMVSG